MQRFALRLRVSGRLVPWLLFVWLYGSSIGVDALPVPWSTDCTASVPAVSGPKDGHAG